MDQVPPLHHAGPMKYLVVNPLRGADRVPGRGRGLAEDPELGAAAGSSTLSFSRLLSTLSTRWHGLWCSGAGSRFCRISLPSLPPRQILELPAMALLTAAARLLGAKVSTRGVSAPFRGGAEATAGPLSPGSSLPPTPGRTPARLKGAPRLACRQPSLELPGPCATLPFRLLRVRRILSALAWNLGRVRSPDLIGILHV